MARCGKRTDKYLAGYKSKLFADLSGTVLEIGPGAGANFHHLPRTNVRWIGVEPNAFMKPHLAKEAQRLGVAIELRPGTAENLPAEDGTMDFVISTLVLCSVVDQERALEEVLRVLKPGGRFLFIEHVGAKRGTWLRRIQTLAKPLWRRMGDGCRPDRETRTALERAGFAALEVEEFASPLPIVRPHIAGTAVKAEPARLEWAAVAHFNTDHPHVHIALRGRTDAGPLRLDRAYIKQGIRNHAESLCTAQLGFRTELDALEAERREVDAPRATSLDRRIATNAFGPGGDGTVDLELLPMPRTEGQRARYLFLAARLRTLANMELSVEIEQNRWRIDPAFLSKLRAMQISHDRQKTRALGARAPLGQTDSPSAPKVHDTTATRDPVSPNRGGR